MRELLLREQGCCEFMSFTLTPADGQLVADLQVPTEASPNLAALAALPSRPPRGSTMIRAGR